MAVMEGTIIAGCLEVEVLNGLTVAESQEAVR